MARNICAYMEKLSESRLGNQTGLTRIFSNGIT